MTLPKNVEDAVDRVDYFLAFCEPGLADMQTIRAELHRLTAIADSVDPLVVRLGEVAEKLARANALLRECLQYHGVMLMSDPPQDAWKYHRMNERINAHLSENAHDRA